MRIIPKLLRTTGEPIGSKRRKQKGGVLTPGDVGRIKTEFPGDEFNLIGHHGDEIPEISEIAHGGFGTVYKITYPGGSKEPFVYKKFRDSPDSDELKRNFDKGMLGLKLVKSLGIDDSLMGYFISEDNLPNIVLKYLGHDIFSIFPEKMKFPNIEDLLLIALSVLKQLEKLHLAGYVHRDIKLENICCMESQDGEITRATLIDWEWTTESTQVWTQVLATESYAAPELFKAPNEYMDLTPADMFAFGVCLYTLLHLNYPFPDRRMGGINLVEGRSINAVQFSRVVTNFKKPSFSNESYPFFKELTDRLLSKNPGVRPSAQEAIHFLYEKYGGTHRELFEGYDPHAGGGGDPRAGGGGGSS